MHLLPESTARAYIDNIVVALALTAKLHTKPQQVLPRLDFLSAATARVYLFETVVETQCIPIPSKYMVQF